MAVSEQFDWLVRGRTLGQIDAQVEDQYSTFFSFLAREALYPYAVKPVGDSFDQKQIPADPHGKQFDPIELEIMASLGLPSDESVADICCGVGDFIERLHLLGHNGKLLGVDRTNLFADTANRFAKNPNVNFAIGDARFLPVRVQK